MSFIKRTLTLNGKISGRSKKKKGNKKSKKTGDFLGEDLESSTDGGSTVTLSRASSKSYLGASNLSLTEGTEEFALALKLRQRETLDDWSQQFGAIWSMLDIVEDRISSSLQMVKIRNEVQLAEQQSLVLDYQEWGTKVINIIVLGEQISDSEILEDEHKDPVKNDVNEIQIRWQKIKEGYDKVEARVQVLLLQQSTSQNWKRRWSINMVWIKEKQEHLSSIEELDNSFTVLEKAAKSIEAMLEDISTYRPNVDNVISYGTGVIKDGSIDHESAPSIRSDIRTLESSWEYLKEKCAAVQLSIQDKLVVVLEQDETHMKEWEQVVNKIDAWLTKAERDTHEFDQANEDILNLEEQVGKHAELVFRLATEQKETDESLEQGDEFIGKVRSNDFRNKIKMDVKALTKRKSKINTKLVGQQESLTSRLDWLINIEMAELETWKTHAKQVDEHLNTFESATEYVQIENVKQAREQITTQEALLNEIDDYSAEIDKLSEVGELLITDKKVGKTKGGEIKEENKSLRDRLGKIKEKAFAKLRESQEELLNLQQQKDDKLGSWITKAQIFDDDLDRFLKTLNLLGGEDAEKLSLEKLLIQDNQLKETKIDVLNKTNRLETLVEEGEKLASSENMQEEEQDKHEQIAKYLKDLKEKWNDISERLQDTATRIHIVICEKQGDLLHSCWEQLEALEQILESAEPIGASIEELRNDTHDISNFYNQLDKTLSDIQSFDNHAIKMQTMTLPSDGDKLEILENNDLLQVRLPNVIECAGQRKSDIREKVTNVVTESLVAFADTLLNLEGNVQNIGVPDSLEGDDLVDRLLNMEDILSRLNECATMLLDLEMLLEEAEKFFKFDNEETKDTKWEISVQKQGIERLQQLTREKKSSLYALMIYHYKRHLDQLEKKLVVTETQFAGETGDATDFKGAVNNLRKMEDLAGDLENIQQTTEDLTLQINAIIGEPILSEFDRRGLKDKNRDVVDHLASVAELGNGKFKKCQQKLKPLLSDKLEQLWEWIQMMENRREGDEQIGPDSMALKKQMREMQVVEKQMNEKRISPIIHFEDPIALHALDAPELKSMRDADHNWYNMSEWVSKRSINLLQAQNAWELFRQKEVDLLDYLRDQEKQVKNWEPINLEEEESVMKRLNQLDALKIQMESKKGDVGDLHQVSDDLIEIIGRQTTTANNIRSQVGDIHDCWNNVVKQVLEAGSKLNVAKQRLKSLEENVKEVRIWLDDAQSVLKFYTDDIPEDVAEDLRPKIEEKLHQESFKLTTLKKANHLCEEIVDELDDMSFDAIQVDMINLNKDWSHVSGGLQKIREQQTDGNCWSFYKRVFVSK